LKVLFKQITETKSQRIGIILFAPGLVVFLITSIVLMNNDGYGGRSWQIFYVSTFTVMISLFLISGRLQKLYDWIKSGK
jgi:hypothetical protein